MLWLMYHVECEEYDRMICGSDGIPKSIRERNLITHHALKIRLKVFPFPKFEFKDIGTQPIGTWHEKIIAIRLVDLSLDRAKMELDAIKKELYGEQTQIKENIIPPPTPDPSDGRNMKGGWIT